MIPNSNSNLQRSFSPGLEDVHVWISIPFCLMYIISILGNSFILFIIKTDPTLHEPMYTFPFHAGHQRPWFINIHPIKNTARIYLFNSTEISHDACFAQLFSIHSLMYTESSVLLSMVFDHFVSICIPLRYDSILIPPRIAKMGLVSLFRGMALMFPLPILLKQYQYYQANSLSHSYYLNQELMIMACSDFSVNIIYGFFLTVSSLGLDLLLILLSYVMIFKTLLSLTSHTAHLKALNTCISHVCIVLLFYMPGNGLSVIYRFMNMSSPLVQNVLGIVSWLIPPLMKSIVYSMKTKPIRARRIKVFIK